ncbi:hypothetical protein ANN_02260 [Periplaneta americana]|uniref:Uncharacterized protein n=1 Tax=Periplaneta americana TaxID=6978 RepID=A0ABQ8TZ84_PERAM|nr:hypothetical protein ANN_02260 [Periplaneta americana]
MADLCEGGNEPPGSLKANNNFGSYKMMSRVPQEQSLFTESQDVCRNSALSYDEWGERRKILSGNGLEPGFSALRADALSTKPRRIPIPMPY